MWFQPDRCTAQGSPFQDAFIVEDQCLDIELHRLLPVGLFKRIGLHLAPSMTRTSKMRRGDCLILLGDKERHH